MFAEAVANHRGITLADLAMSGDSVYRCWCGDTECAGYVVVSRATASRHISTGKKIIGGIDLRESLWP